jgi:hypothetical protein
MRKLALAALSTAALFALSPTVPAYAAGEILITQAKALAGNVTPGDTPGFPVILSMPGSYLLGSNLAVPANADGVSITAHDVTLDLSGFRIYGSGAANNGVVGGTPSVSVNSITIRNGTIALFKQDGVKLIGDFDVIEQIRAVANGGYGLSVSGGSALIQDNVLSGNFSGISAGGALIQGNVISQNTSAGISVRRSTILGNNITSNGNVGIFGHPPVHGIPSLSGYGNNTLVGNNNGGAQVSGSVSPLHANTCLPVC